MVWIADRIHSSPDPDPLVSGAQWGRSGSISAVIIFSRPIESQPPAASATQQLPFRAKLHIFIHTCLVVYAVHKDSPILSRCTTLIQLGDPNLPIFLSLQQHKSPAIFLIMHSLLGSPSFRFPSVSSLLPGSGRQCSFFSLLPA